MRKTDTFVSFRVTLEQRAELKRRAEEADKSMTDYVLGLVLGTTDKTPGLADRVETLERRVAELEAR